MKSVSASA
uniref:Uncharacterized protein n=1 Tax=Rhizophora mucronata TaxID=61149 RepID=A0A2P2NU38_RHIMU